MPTSSGLWAQTVLHHFITGMIGWGSPSVYPLLCWPDPAIQSKHWTARPQSAFEISGFPWQGLSHLLERKRQGGFSFPCLCVKKVRQPFAPPENSFKLYDKFDKLSRFQKGTVL